MFTIQHCIAYPNRWYWKNAEGFTVPINSIRPLFTSLRLYVLPLEVTHHVTFKQVHLLMYWSIIALCFNLEAVLKYSSATRWICNTHYYSACPFLLQKLKYVLINMMNSQQLRSIRMSEFGEAEQVPTRELYFVNLLYQIVNTVTVTTF